MTQWTICKQTISGVLPMYRASRIVDGAEELDIHIYGTRDEAQKRVQELNTKKEEEQK